MDYLLFDPAPFDFAPPRLPVMPALRVGALCWQHRGDPIPAWAEAGRLYGRARYALHDAYQLSGAGPQGGLLAPSYHCRTMIDPALALQAPVQCYRLDAALNPDLNDIARLLGQARVSGVPVKAVLASHFFGLPQDLRGLAALCKQHGATLVEDCAHGLPLRQPFNQMGATGTWCVASPYKFFACEEGGALWSGTGQPMPLPPLHPPGLVASLRQLPRLRARHRQTLANTPAPPRRPAPSAQELDEAQHLAMRQAGPSTDYQTARQTLACDRLSRWLIAHTDIGQLLARRRANYQRLVDALRGLPGTQLPMPVLGPHDTPYMLPLLIDRPERHFVPLKRSGLPIWRWDSLVRSPCPTAAAYRLRLLHLPIHQSLSDADLDWMIRTLAHVLSDTTGELPA